jgi:hypothetical protein
MGRGGPTASMCIGSMLGEGVIQRVEGGGGGSNFFWGGAEV